MQQNVRIKKLDDWKWVAAFLVIAIHTSPLESVSECADFILTRVIGRIAVPLFFMITGYFVLQKNEVIGSLKKLFIMYLKVTLLYLPIQIYRYVPIEQFHFTEVVKGILKAIFFEGTYYHLWYIPAVIEGLVIVYLLLKLGKRTAFLISAILYVLGLLGDSYYGMMKQNPLCSQVYEGMFTLFSHTRNGIFFAPLFILLGYSLSSVHIKPKKRALCYFIFCLLLMCVEGLLLHFAGWQRHDSLYVFLPFCMLFLFLYLTADEEQKYQISRPSRWREGPMLLYFIHPYVILLVRGFVKITGLTVFINCSPLYYVMVLSISTIVVIGYLGYKDKWMIRKGKAHVSERETGESMDGNIHS